MTISLDIKQIEVLELNQELHNMYEIIKSMKLKYISYFNKKTGVTEVVKIKSKRITNYSADTNSVTIKLVDGMTECIHAGMIDIQINEDHILLYESETYICKMQQTEEVEIVEEIEEEVNIYELREKFNSKNKKSAFTLDKQFEYSDGIMSEREKIEDLALLSNTKLDFSNNRYWIEREDNSIGISKLAAKYFDYIKQSFNLESNYSKMVEIEKTQTVKERIKKNEKQIEKLIKQWQSENFSSTYEINNKINKLKSKVEEDKALLSQTA